MYIRLNAIILITHMQKILLEPQRLIAMMDYPPLHSPAAFRSYYEKYESGAEVEPVVVIPVEAAMEYFATKPERYTAYKEILNQFLSNHASATHFMLGGKHRSAAATVLGSKIPCLIVESDTDVAQVHEMMTEGKLTGVPSVGEDFSHTLSELEEHYFEHKKFWSMDEKTEAMIKNEDIPKDMIKIKLK